MELKIDDNTHVEIKSFNSKWRVLGTTDLYDTRHRDIVVALRKKGMTIKEAQDFVGKHEVPVLEHLQDGQFTVGKTISLEQVAHKKITDQESKPFGPHEPSDDYKPTFIDKIFNPKTTSTGTASFNSLTQPGSRIEIDPGNVPDPDKLPKGLGKDKRIYKSLGKRGVQGFYDEIIKAIENAPQQEIKSKR
jgi:hypothetical protein